jgi:hypothetical protein
LPGLGDKVAELRQIRLGGEVVGLVGSAEEAEQAVQLEDGLAGRCLVGWRWCCLALRWSSTCAAPRYALLRLTTGDLVFGLTFLPYGWSAPRSSAVVEHRGCRPW